MSSYTFSFRDPPGCPLYQAIIDGTKTVEGRKNSEQYQKIKQDDTIMFDYENRGILVCKVTYVNKYADVEEYLNGESLQVALPCADTIEDGIKIYERFVPKDEITKLKNKYGFGFLGIGIKFLYERKRYEIHISEPWFSYIVSGKKIAEGRPNKSLFAKFKPKDILTIFNKQLQQRFEFEITEILKYDTFKEMLTDLGIENVLPGISTIDDGIAVYRQWYNEDIEREFGVLAIKINPYFMAGGYYKKYMKYKLKYINLKSKR
jgi:ASC-1-like (ASCH) protein